MSVDETPLTKQTLSKTSTYNVAAFEKLSKRKGLKSLCYVFFVEC